MLARRGGVASRRPGARGPKGVYGARPGLIDHPGVATKLVRANAPALRAGEGIVMNECRMSEVIVDKAFIDLPEAADKRTIISLMAESLAGSKWSR
jgi:hypothetical protein